MRLFSRLASLIVSLIALLAVAPPVFAGSDTGSHAWSTRPLVLRSGPGAAYGVTGEIAADVAIRVLRCQRLWCVVDGDGGRGWTGMGAIAFGRTSTDWPGGINPDYPAGGPGSVCFFTGANYTGTSLCAGPGRVFNDLALLNMDNHFRSVQLTGNVSVAACRDRFFQSYCERIIESQPVLDQYLVNSLSSARIY
ncbi:SH3 domain-containing protein [Devosia lacusdianchii]|uniref:SH3 domain-containing protein n=1 Tax=Devosia lacusdianchii TaxID=2917991 RepID=UPI001F064109|nr:SH3 domain-containing protein [Devosia sp. JXJ CY 41]